MNMEKIILELMGRIQLCEERLSEADEEILKLKKKILENDEKTQIKLEETKEKIEEKSISRSEIRKRVIDEIKSNLKCPELSIRVGNREEGSGIVLSRNNKNIYYKFYYSRTYGDITDERVISWSGVLQKDLKPYFSGYIFAIVREEKIYTLIFSYNEIIRLIDEANREVDSKGKYHFSFQINNKSIFEIRGTKAIDVSYSLDNYKSIADALA
ncbi:hypothetical protein [Paramaledivibacter caminithermalis]|jgi:hypothetical protein|uniref:Uncharacterized protein n=1 Tax=Paramaledivibacter caminithermalis (strain DSM 15212 / CIP 107654 / DViRD3) TaxID=1121301 RepID=A0A1M6NAF8_PARC5|nr:hypothetical protein [Paramaledivibacter caminithermalis]SHJ92681.1 hypothetical protein SAMN02745912_01632 [Paramaledivibacter caminithermalis DSM 15212]